MSLRHLKNKKVHLNAYKPLLEAYFFKVAFFDEMERLYLLNLEVQLCVEWEDLEEQKPESDEKASFSASKAIEVNKTRDLARGEAL